MRILVTHLTRMARGFCCVAGFSEGDHLHIRPVMGGRRLTTDLLAPDGPFDMRAIVDLGRVHRAGHTPPEVEDHLFEPSRTKRLGYASPERLWDILESDASDSLYELFGPELERHGERASVAILSGRASLGTYRPMLGADLLVREVDGRTSLRVRLPGEGLDLSLTDARYFVNDFQDPHLERALEAKRYLASGGHVILGVGLTRPFASSEDQAERHWLQVNAIHLEQTPGLRLV